MALCARLLARRGLPGAAAAARPCALPPRAPRLDLQRGARGLHAATALRPLAADAAVQDAAALLRALAPLLDPAAVSAVAPAQQHAAPEWVGGFEMSSVLKKRRKKMTKHKLRKRRKKDRYKNK